MTLISQQIFKNIRRIQIQTTRMVNDVFGGAYLSAFKGKGMEFEEVREYQPGDEIRNVDWNVTARMQHPFVKNFKEERELRVMLMVDVSSSSHFGINHQKSTWIAEIAAVLALSAIKNHDNVGLILFSNKIEKYLPPKNGLRHVLRVIRELLVFQPQERGTDIANALTFLGKVQRRPTVCFLISDFLAPDFSKDIAIIAKKHDLTAISVLDQNEIHFPQLGLVHLCDLETQEKLWIDSENETVKEAYQSKALSFQSANKALMKKMGVGFIQLYTDQPYAQALRNYFHLKERRR